MASKQWTRKQGEKTSIVEGAAHAIGEIIEDIGDLANVCGVVI